VIKFNSAAIISTALLCSPALGQTKTAAPVAVDPGARAFSQCSTCHTLERVPINWNQLIGKTTLYFKVLERLAFAQSGEKRSKVGATQSGGAKSSVILGPARRDQ
jgi:hypothetical protein